VAALTEFHLAKEERHLGPVARYGAHANSQVVIPMRSRVDHDKCRGPPAAMAGPQLFDGR